MASKAYVASLTLSELKQELKQRGLSARGGKKELLRDRLEQVRQLYKYNKLCVTIFLYALH